MMIYSTIYTMGNDIYLSMSCTTEKCYNEHIGIALIHTDDIEFGKYVGSGEQLLTYKTEK